jgi:hypothetical protein
MIKDISEKIISELKLAFTDKRELANPYDVERNSTQMLSNGFGVTIGAGAVDNYDSSVFTVMNRTFKVVLTKGFYASDVNYALRQAAESSLLDDTEEAISVLKSSTDLKQITVDIDYESDDGIELLEAGKLSVLIQTITMSIRYKRTI